MGTQFSQFKTRKTWSITCPLLFEVRKASSTCELANHFLHTRLRDQAYHWLPTAAWIVAATCTRMGGLQRMNNKADDTNCLFPCRRASVWPISTRGLMRGRHRHAGCDPIRPTCSCTMQTVSRPPHLAYDRAYIDPFRTCRAHAPNRSCRMPFVMRLHNYQLL
jgi:hypothetical protein